MKFYKYDNLLGYWMIGDKHMLSKRANISITQSQIHITFIDGENPIDAEVTTFEKENGDNYISVSDFLSECESFFINGKLVSDNRIANEMVNAEHAIADIIAHLVGRIKTLEELLVASRYNTIQVKELSVVENIKLKGADKQLFGTGAPTVTPDFAGQEYLDQTAKIWYDAVGVVNAGDWKPRTNV